MRMLMTTLFMILFGAIVGCSSLRTPESEVPSVSGKWRIQQTNAGGSEFTGTLTLEQHGSGFSGSVSWNHHGRSRIVNGTVSGEASKQQGSIVCFVIEYDGELRGKYYATLNPTHKLLFDGTAIVIQGGSDTGIWNATLIEE